MSIAEADIDDFVADHIDQVLDLIEDRITSSNAEMWMMDDYEVSGYEYEEGRCLIQIWFQACGEPDEEHMYLGHLITGDVEMIVRPDGGVEFNLLDVEGPHSYEE